MILYRARRTLLALWRELVVALTAGAAGAMLLARAPSLWALAVLLAGAAGGTAILLQTVRGGHLRRALAWPRLGRDLGIAPWSLARPPLPSLADAAEAILTAVAAAPSQLRGFLAPAASEARDVLRRSMELAKLARQRRRQIALPSREDLSAAVTERRAQLADAVDAEDQRQLASSIEAIDVQRRLLGEHQRAVASIEHELDAAAQTLRTVAAEIAQA
ncbi:MAG: hypothetical protein V1750_05065, partial [Acidobacteriota bacterium]